MRASLPLGLAAALIPALAGAQDRITVISAPGQTITIVAEPAAASRVPALAGLLAPHAGRVGRWAGRRPPVTIFLVDDRERVPDPPGPLGELPGAQVDLERSAIHVWAGLVPEGREPPPAALTRVLSTFLVQTSLRQLVGRRPGVLPVWLVVGLLDDASLAPPAPVPPRGLADAPFLALLHPTFNAPFLELLETRPALGAAVARALVDDLLARAAPLRLGDFLRALGTADFDAAFEKTYGLTLEAYQQEMARTLGNRRGL